jgi:hypothetical protein
LQHNVTVAERVVNPPKQAVSVFADTQSSEVKDRIFDEFNSLSVVYQKVTAVWYPWYLINSSLLLGYPLPLSFRIVLKFLLGGGGGGGHLKEGLEIRKKK